MESSNVKRTSCKRLDQLLKNSENEHSKLSQLLEADLSVFKDSEQGLRTFIADLKLQSNVFRNFFHEAICGLCKNGSPTEALELRLV